jgi:CheY-like chemotaxis protein
MAADPSTVILVVDDDPDIRYLLQQLLEDGGYRVRVATDGGQAIAELERRLPSLVLLDLMMPVMSGWETLAAIRARGWALPVVFMSAGSNLQTQAIASQADGYISKPFDVDAMFKLLTNCLCPAETPAQPGAHPGMGLLRRRSRF